MAIDMTAAIPNAATLVKRPATNANEPSRPLLPGTQLLRNKRCNGIFDDQYVESAVPSLRTRDATDIRQQLVSIGMLNVVRCRNRLKVLYWDGYGTLVIMGQLQWRWRLFSGNSEGQARIAIPVRSQPISGNGRHDNCRTGEKVSGWKVKGIGVCGLRAVA